jgi:hypothetical protein
MKPTVVVATFLVCLSCPGNAITILGLSNGKSSVEALEHVFFRSDETRANSMAAIMRSMTPAKAEHILKERHLDTPALMAATQMAMTKQSRQSPTGYSALAGAKKLLNDMIFNASSKYDVEIAACTEFYTKQCASL